jgi:polygalacturonase
MNLMHSYLSRALIIITLFLNIEVIAKQNDDKIKRLTSNLPFDMPEIVLPQIPDHSVVVTDFDAVGDGHTLNTIAFSKAIRTCAEDGGGRVIVPAGIWFTGPISLENNIDLHLEKGAIIKFSPRFEDYPVIQTSWEGLPLKRCTSPINGNGLKNIAITGDGIIDGSGDAWRPVLKNEMAELKWNELLRSGGFVKEARGTLIWWPSEAASQGKLLVAELESREDAVLEDYSAVREYLRPVLVSLIECQSVLLDGPTFQNSPAWNIHPLLCKNVVIRNIVVRNPWYSTNGDGLDLESCRNVVVFNCRFDVGDDAICIKSGRNEYGRNRGIPCENISIAECTVYHGHGGFVIGSEMSGGARNISVRDCLFLGTDLGLRFKSTRGRGGVVEDIFISNILMESILTDAIRFNMFYQGTSPSVGDRAADVSDDYLPPVTEETPQFHRIYIKDIICNSANRAVFFQGLPEMAIKNIELNNVIISARSGLTLVDADQIKLNKVCIRPERGPAYSFYNSSNVCVTNTEIPGENRIFLKLSGRKTKNIVLKDYDLNHIKEYLEFGKDVSTGVILREK